MIPLPEVEHFLLNVAEFSFPMLIACYLLFRVQKQLAYLTEAVMELRNELSFMVRFRYQRGDADV